MIINILGLPDLNREGERPNLIAELCYQSWKIGKPFKITKAYPYLRIPVSYGSFSTLLW